MRARSRVGARGAGALVGLLLLTACGAGAETGTEQSDFTGQRLDPPFVVDGAQLTQGSSDGDGAPYSLTESTEAPLTLVFFGYTNCPDICGQVMSTMASAMTRLDDAQRDAVDVVFVTTDPARDDEAAVADYATAYDDSFIGVTGDLDTIVEVGRSMAIGVEKGERLPSGGYDITHGTQVMAVGEDDQAHAYWNADTSSAQMAGDISTLLSE